MFLIAVFFLKKITPFGNNTTLIWDANSQYIDYLTYFKTILLGKNNIFYTFSKNIGGDMIGLSSYYLLSPFNLLFLFFPKNMFLNVFSLIIILKISFCSLSFCYFLSKFKNFSYFSLIFSLTYAFSGYMSAYFWSTIWLEGVIIFPLILVGIINLINKKKSLFYILSLFLIIITNYYIGYMLCIISAFSFLAILIYKYKLIYIYKNNEIINIIKKYIFASFLSISLSSIVLIPTIFSLIGGKATIDIDSLKFIKNFYFFDLLGKLFTGSINFKELTFGLPNIFSGFFILILIIFYFLNKKIKLKEKIISATILLVFYFSFYINSINLILHGLNLPACFPYRYSFTLCFFMIFLAYRSFLNFQKIQFKNIFFSILLLTTLVLFVYKKHFYFLSTKTIIIDIIVILLYLLLLYLYCKNNNQKNKNIIILIIAFIQLFNLGYNFLISANDLINISGTKKDVYLNYIEKIEPIIKKIKNEDKDFYRIEKNFCRSKNDAMQFNYNGLTHFSSSEKKDVIIFMDRLGFKNTGIWAQYGNSYTNFSKNFLGIKYYLKCNEPSEITSEQLNKIIDLNNIKIEKNNFAMPIGFAISNKIKNINMKERDPFRLQNNIIKLMLNNDNDNIDYFNKILYKDMLLINLKKEDKFYQKINEEKEAFIIFKIKVKKNNNLLSYINAPHNQFEDIYINNKLVYQHFNVFSWEIIKYINNNIKNEDEYFIEYKIKINSKKAELNDFYFYHEDIVNENIAFHELKNQVFKCNKHTSSSLNGLINITKDNQYMVFTIPFDKGWEIIVDEKKIKYEKILETLIGFPLKKGNHTISLKFIPRGIYLGASISIISFFILCILIYFNKKY